VVHSIRGFGGVLRSHRVAADCTAAFQINHGDRRRRVGRGIAGGGVSADRRLSRFRPGARVLLARDQPCSRSGGAGGAHEYAARYLTDIGLRYLLIPVISTSMGLVAARVRATA